MPGSGQVAHVLQHHVARLLCAQDLEDVKEERSTGLVADAHLGTGLREGLAGEPGAEQVMVGDQAADLPQPSARLLVVDDLPRDGTNVLHEPLRGEPGKAGTVDLPTLGIEFACHHATSPQRLHGMVEPTDAGEEVDEAEARGRHFGIVRRAGATITSS